jgi:hypothetical protein
MGVRERMGVRSAGRSAGRSDLHRESDRGKVPSRYYGKRSTDEEPDMGLGDFHSAQDLDEPVRLLGPTAD